MSTLLASISADHDRPAKAKAPFASDSSKMQDAKAPIASKFSEMQDAKDILNSWALDASAVLFEPAKKWAIHPAFEKVLQRMARVYVLHAEPVNWEFHHIKDQGTGTWRFRPLVYEHMFRLAGGYDTNWLRDLPAPWSSFRQFHQDHVHNDSREDTNTYVF